MEAKTFAVTPFPPPQIEELPEEAGFHDPLGDPGDVLGNDDTLPVDAGVAQNAADIYSVAAMKPVSVSAVLAKHAAIGDATSTDITDLLTNIKDEDASVQKDLMIAAISNPHVGVEQRIRLAQAVSELEGYDLNSVLRQGLHNLNIMENSGDTPEEQDDFDKGAEAAEDVPKNVEADSPLPADSREISEYAARLYDAYSQADENTGGMDWVGTVIPFRFEAPVIRIYNQLGIGGGEKVLLGEALRRIREHVSGLDEAGKMQALDIVLKALKPNAGVFKDGNDLVTMHVLEEIFYKDMFKTDPNQNSLFPKLATNLLNLLPTPDIQKATEKFLRDTGVRGSAILDNFGSILDWVGVGSLAKTTLRFGTKWLPKSIRLMKKVTPEQATRMAVDALDDETIRLKFPNMTKEDVVSSFLPASNKALQEGGVEGMGELIARQLDIRDRMLRLSDRTNLSAAERADAFAEIRAQYGDIAAAPNSTLHLNESVFAPSDAGMTIEAIFGRTKAKSFSSYAQAVWAAKEEIMRTFGTDAAMSVVWRNPATGLLEEVPKGMKPFTKGEFFLKVKDERAYESAPSLYHSLTMGDNEVANLRFAPSLWKHLRGVTNLLSKEAADNLRLSSRQRTEWNKLTAGLLTDVASLSTKQSRILSKVLKDGEEVVGKTGTGKVYGPSELADMGLDEAGQRAYYAYRNATDIMYEVANKQTRVRMFRDGVKDLHGPTGRVGFVQPRSLMSAGEDIGRGTQLHVYDPITNTFVQLDRAALDALYKSGKMVAKLEEPMLGKGGKEASHAIIDEAGGTKLLGLPRQVLTKTEGYYPHMWNGNYIVYGVTKAGNRFALGLASNEADAKATVQRMMKVNATRKAKGKATRFEEVSYDFDRSLTTDMARRGGVQEGLYANMGGPVYGHRNGGALRNFSKSSGDILVDPIEAMMRGMEIVGTKTTKQETANYMRQKLYNYAKDQGILRDPRVIPATADDLTKTAAKQVQYNKAKAYLDAIDNMLNTRDGVDEAVSKFFLSASGIASRYLGKTEAGRALAAKLGTKAARGGDPMSGIMGLLHRTTIASSPMGQFALQASQSLMMLGVAPLQYMKAVRQVGGLAMLVGMRSNALHGGKAFALTQKEFMKEVDVIAKVVGMSPEELVKVVDTVMDNGLVSAVGYHSQMRNAIRSAAEERMLIKAKGLNKPMVAGVARFARGVDAQTFGRLSQVGFEAGESMNQMTTFLTLYNRDKAKGIANLSDSDYVKKLLGSVAELTGDMIPETGFTYQRGWFKAAMQFVSFQHKMMLLMLPQAIGGAKSLTAAEKAGMVFTQFLLFGRRGAAHMDAIYRAVDDKIREHASEQGEEDQMYAAWNDPKTKAVMDGLIMDTAANYVIKELFGEQPDYSLSTRFAPGGGSEFMMDRLFAIASNPTSAIFGLAGEKVSKLYSFAKRVGDVTLANIREHDDVPLDERFAELAKEGGALAMSQYNRYLATQAAARMDGWVSAGGKVSEGFSGQLEGMLYTQFGITTKDRESLYEAMDKFHEEQINNPLARTKNLDEMVDQYYKDLIQTAVKFDKEAPNDQVWGTLMDKWARERGLLFSVLPPVDAEYINGKVAERLERASRGSVDSAETVLVERLTKDIRDGRFGQEGPDVALYLEQAEFVKNNPKLYEIVRQSWVDATTDDGE